jgi:hypothetical protein
MLEDQDVNPDSPDSPATDVAKPVFISDSTPVVESEPVQELEQIPVESALVISKDSDLEHSTPSSYPKLDAAFSNPNVSQEFECEVPNTRGQLITNRDEYIAHLALPIKDTIEIAQVVPEVGETDTDLSKRWTQTLQASTLTTPSNLRFVSTIE